MENDEQIQQSDNDLNTNGAHVESLKEMKEE